MDRSEALDRALAFLEAANSRDALRALLSLEAKSKSECEAAEAVGITFPRALHLFAGMAEARLITTQFTGSPDVYRPTAAGRWLVRALAALDEVDLHEQRAELSARGMG